MGMINKVILERNQTASFMAYACKSARRWHYEQRDKNRWKALEPIWKGIKNFFETTRENVTEGLSLRRDHAI